MRTKILLLFAVFFCIVLISNAQVNTGRYLLGGSFNMFQSKDNHPYNDGKNNGLNANIQFGKVVKENTVVGVILSYSYYNYDYTAPHSNDGKNYGAGIFYRKYKKLAKDFYFFGEADGAYAYSENNFTQLSGYKLKTNGGTLSFIPGVSYAICKRMQIELSMPNIISLSYTHNKTDYTSDPAPPPPTQKGNNFTFNTNFNSNLLSSFGIGFNFFFR
ncbi:MAG: hypothetical protein ABI863_01815 [Ginsengibacter sp.]